MRLIICFFLILVILTFATSIPTANDNNQRTAWNINETSITPANVTTMGKLGTYTVDAAVYALPLVIDSVKVGSTTYNLLIVVTMNDSIYAFDADTPGSAYIWKTSVGTALTSYPNDGFLYNGSVGCLSTPVIDFNHILYAVCATSIPTWVINKIDITTGSVLSTASITGQVIGTGTSGDPTSGSNLVFYSSHELNRAGLAVYNGTLYIPFGAFDDEPPWHGWMFAYSTSALSQTGIFCTTPNDFGGGIWQASGAPAIDTSGNIYVATGNGGYDGSTNFSDSILKLSPTLSILDWLTPSDYATLETNDLDMSSGRPILIPGTTLVAVGEKDFNVYVQDTTCMGHVVSSGFGGCPAAQIFPTNASGTTSHSSGIYGGMFMNGVGYWPNTGGLIYAFTFSSGSFVTTPLATSGSTFSYPGAQLSGSSNGASNGIVWGITFAQSDFTAAYPGTLRALNPSTLAEYWNSSATADVAGNITKLSSPVVTNGKIYISTVDGDIVVYGLKGTSIKGSAVVNGSVVIH